MHVNNATTVTTKAVLVPPLSLSVSVSFYVVNIVKVKTRHKITELVLRKYVFLNKT